MRFTLLTKALLSALASTLMLLLVFLYTQGGFGGASVGALKQALLPGELGKSHLAYRSDRTYGTNEANSDSYYDNDKAEEDLSLRGSPDSESGDCSNLKPEDAGGGSDCFVAQPSRNDRGGKVLGDSVSSGHTQGSSSSSSTYNSTTYNSTTTPIDFSRLGISEYQLNSLIAQQLTNLASIGLLGHSQGLSSLSPAPSYNSTTYTPVPVAGSGTGQASTPAPPVITYIQPAPSQNFSGASLLSATDLSSKNFTTATANITDTATIKTLSVTDTASIAGDLTVTGTITGNVSGTINPNLTTGSLLFQGPSGIAENNANLFWDNTNKRLGVGTATPTDSIDITGDLAVGRQLVIHNNYAVGAELYSHAAAGFRGPTLSLFRSRGTQSAPTAVQTADKLGYFQFFGYDGNAYQAGASIEANAEGAWSSGVTPGYLIFTTTGGNERMRITAAGNVGVGTSSPSSLVHIKGADHTRLTVESPAGYLAGIALQPSGTFASSGTWTVDARGTYDATNNRLAVSNIGSGEVFTVLSNGNVGIGTTNPIARLHIEGTAAPYTPYIVLNDNSSVMSGINFRDGGISEWSIVRNDAGNSIQIIEEGVGTRATFAEGGNVGIGTTTPAGKLVVKGSGTTTGVGIQTQNSSGTALFTTLDNGFVGIGTASPTTARVEIKDAGTSANALLRIISDDENPYGLVLNNDTYSTNYLNGFKIYQDNTGLAKISNGGAAILLSGTVGINMSSAPTARFAVNGNAAFGTYTVAPTNGLAVSGQVSVGATTALATIDAIGAIYSGATPTNTVFNGTIAPNTANFVATNGYWALRTALNNSYNLDVYNSGSPIAALTVLQNGNVGIGTTSPGQKLQVSGGNLKLDYGYNIRFRNGTDTGDISLAQILNNNEITFGDANTGAVAINTTGTERMRVTSAGNVGIGTTSPGSLLHVTGSNAVFRMQGTAVGGAAVAYMLLTDSAGTGIGYIGDSSASNQVLEFQGSPNTSVQIGSNNSPVIYIPTSGNVGVGASSPQSKFSVNGNMAVGASYIGTTAPANGLLVEGNVGIGTTNPAQQLQLTGNFRMPATTSTTGIIYQDTSTFIHNFGVNNTFVGVSAGNLTLSNATGQNTAVGQNALIALTSGNRNTAIGSVAGTAITTGTYNTALGWSALSTLTVGNYNVALGRQALKAATGDSSVAIGTDALLLATGSNNTAVGDSAGANITTGGSNIIIGAAVNAPSASGSNQLNIGNLIYGTGVQSGGVAGTSTPTGGNVGIGTTSPTQKLYVNTGAATIDIRASTVGQGGLNIVGDAPTSYAPSLKLYNASTLVGTLGASMGGEYSASAGTNDVILRSDVAKLLLQSGTGAAALTINTSNNVGIGTTSPGEKLHLVGNFKMNGVIYNSDTGTGFDVGGNQWKGFAGGQIIYDSQAAKILAKFSNGSVLSTGDSTVAANASLTVPKLWADQISATDAGGGTAGRSFTVKAGDSSTQPQYGGGNGGNLVLQGGKPTDNSLGNGGTAGYIAFNTYAFGASSPTERMRIASDGNVGIGTTSPGAALAFPATNGEKIRLYDGGANSVGLGVATSEFRLYATASAATTFYVGGYSGTELMRLDSSGRLGVGTADYDDWTLGSNNISSKAVIDSPSASTTIAQNPALVLRNSNGTANNHVALGFSSVESNTVIGAFIDAQFYAKTNPWVSSDLIFGTGDTSAPPAERMRLDSQGNLGIGTTTPSQLLHVYRSTGGVVARFTDADGSCDIDPTSTALVCSSDATLKKDITTLSGVLPKLQGMRGVSFKWKTQEDEALRIGVIAQEVEAVFPELVRTDTVTGKKSVNYTGLSPILLQAVKEQQDEITTLQNQIASLQGMHSLSGNTPITFHSHLYLSADSVGQAKILAGSTSVRVTFDRPYQYQPVVTVTATGDSALLADYRYAVVEKDATGFTIKINNAQGVDLEFDYHVFASPSAKLTVSDGTTQQLLLVLPPQPAPENPLPGQVAGESTEQGEQESEDEGGVIQGQGAENASENGTAQESALSTVPN